MELEEFRQKLNNVETVKDMYEVLSGYNFKRSFYKANTMIAHINGFIIGIKDDFSQLYVTSRGELLFNETEGCMHKSVIDYILDNICNLDTSNAFYQLYFGKYQYPITDDESEIVIDVLSYFNEKKAVISNIFTNNKYNSATITGKKTTNGCEVEYRLVNCDKQDIVDIISITHVTPIMNKENNYNDDYFNPYYNKPTAHISDKDIMDSYNDYKDSLAYD